MISIIIGCVVVLNAFLRDKAEVQDSVLSKVKRSKKCFSSKYVRDIVYDFDHHNLKAFLRGIAQV